MCKAKSPLWRAAVGNWCSLCGDARSGGRQSRGHRSGRYRRPGSRRQNRQCRRRGGLPASRCQHRGQLAQRDRGPRAPLRAFGRDGGQRRDWGLVQGCRDVVGRLAPADRGQPRWRLPVGEVCCASDAPLGRRFHHHYVIRCRSSRIGRIGWLLRHKGRCKVVRQGGGDGVRSRGRWGTGRHRPSPGS